MGAGPLDCFTRDSALLRCLSEVDDVAPLANGVRQSRKKNGGFFYVTTVAADVREEMIARMGTSAHTIVILLFGGYKESGVGGRDNGLEAFEQYTETKPIWISLGLG